MPTFALSKQIIEMLNLFDGDTTEKKVVNLVNGNASLKLKECEDEIVKFESKYGMIFKDFEIIWNKGKISDKYSHQTERDYIEWEGFEQEKKHWLSALKEIRIKYFPKR
ncbi:hypothetical protein A3J90_02890 [candidate division WOR-1 bacterium RIFOXYC2_FULL_37_10]|uniref:Uncharacterized protein n=1 Tax=candidate division WOR-1 bacterium RIFOXYB2_FULL_37_13 TaxID=1802579 RepID=A0A1F4SPI5_UNCSA|nr:MAG: hypothetical protein A2246_00085 [candidate division WOR-1 bacterium RIFOXYA2_FULL_37_7]OGC22267.1 MAG: hypothetical protein A2310_01570 [candidate division WOR-1 bacterium RIFOXYB2_FULL_37_13]OGC34559.1 MAG: hypothetical protein A3J90_02890 [candidate division WOR-1 bacterium RIFOXYC2_FULL_37_10]